MLLSDQTSDYWSHSTPYGATQARGGQGKKTTVVHKPQLEMRCRVLHLGPLIDIESRHLRIGRESIFIL